MTLSGRALVAIAAFVLVSGCASGSSSVTFPRNRLPGVCRETPRRADRAAGPMPRKGRRSHVSLSPIFMPASFASTIKCGEPAAGGLRYRRRRRPNRRCRRFKRIPLHLQRGREPHNDHGVLSRREQAALNDPGAGILRAQRRLEGRHFCNGLRPFVYGYRPGAKKPYETIGGFDYPIGLAVDGKNNVWVADEGANKVYVIPAGTTQVKDARLIGVDGPIGISFRPKNAVYVANFAPLNVRVYPAGSKKASATITDGITNPTLNGVTSAGIFFQANLPGNVVGYKKGQRMVRNDQRHLRRDRRRFVALGQEVARAPPDC